jgi:hypothetical protein
MTIRKLLGFTVSCLVFAAACSKQGEGERCNSSNLSNDCEDGLLCEQPQVTANICDPTSTEEGQYNCVPYRCCPSPGTPPSDSRCLGYSVAAPITSTAGGSGSVGGGSTGGSSGSGGTTSDGSSGGAGGIGDGGTPGGASTGGST